MPLGLVKTWFEPNPCPRISQASAFQCDGGCVWLLAHLVYPNPIKCTHTHGSTLPAANRKSFVFQVVLHSSTWCSTLCVPEAKVLVQSGFPLGMLLPRISHVSEHHVYSSSSSKVCGAMRILHLLDPESWVIWLSIWLSSVVCFLFCRRCWT